MYTDKCMEGSKPHTFNGTAA